jgi:hypothetical protein
MQCQEQTTDFKGDLAALYDELVSKDVPEDDELSVAHSALEVELSDIASKFKGLLAAAPSETSPLHSASDSSGVKLPRLDVLTFDGNIIHWKQFLDQFSVSVHDRTRKSSIFNMPSRMDQRKMQLKASHIPEKTTMKQSNV